MEVESGDLSVVRIGGVSLPMAIGVLIAACGLTIMAEWAFDIRVIAHLSPTDSSMKFNTSFVFFCLGSALALVGSHRRPFVIAAYVLAALAIIISAATLSQYATGIDIGLDQLVFRDHPNPDITSNPGRMSPLVAFDFLLFGASILIWRQRRPNGSRPSEGFAIAALVIPMIAALGYLFSAASLYSFTNVTGVALITAVLLLVLSTGVLGVLSPGGITTIFVSPTRGGFVLRFLLPTSMFAIVAFDWISVRLARSGMIAENLIVPLGTIASGGVITILIWRCARLLYDADVLEKERLAELEAAYRAAEEANRAKDEFISVVSHELRTPLNSILGWLQILRVDASERNVKRALEVIRRQSESQLQLVEDLLDTSRIIAGKMRLDVGPVRLEKVVAEAVETVRPAANAKNIALVFAAPDAAVELDGDPDRLQQVFWNLLSNALKFTPNDGRVEVSLRRNGKSVECCVVDDGEGIESDFLPVIFDRFRQAEETPARRTGGLGLGLSLVRHIVELHGGRVSAHSDGAGKGAKFTVNLPLRRP